MVTFFGDYDTTETVIIPFNTFSSDDPSASVTITDLVAGDVEIHKDGGTTQRSSDNGVTVTIDFDSVTGNHIVSIDLSDDTDAGFYADGSRYQVRMEGTTVDGATISAWIGAFSVGCTLRPTTAGRTLDVTATGAAGIDWGNVENPTTAVDLSGTDIQLCDTVTTLTGHTAQTADHTANIAAILVDTGTTLDGKIDTIDTNVDSILVDTAEIGAAGAGLTSIPWNSNWDTEVQSECDDALTAFSCSTVTTAQVNTEVADVLKTDTVTLPGQVAPPLAPTFEEMISWLYKALRNRTSQTATQWSLYADDESTVDAKATVSDDATTAIKQEIVTGP